MKKLFFTALLLFTAHSVSLHGAENLDDRQEIDASIRERAYQAQVDMGVNQRDILPIHIQEVSKRADFLRVDEDCIYVVRDAFLQYSFGQQRILLLRQAAHVLHNNVKRWKNLLAVCKQSGLSTLLFGLASPTLYGLNLFFEKPFEKPYLDIAYKASGYAGLLGCLVFLITAKRIADQEPGLGFTTSRIIERDADRTAIIACGCMQCAHEFADIRKSQDEVDDLNHGFSLYLLQEEVIELANKHLQGKTCCYHKNIMDFA